jgi:hypothetical protein
LKFYPGKRTVHLAETLTKSRHTTPHHATPRHTTPRHATPRRAIKRNTTLHSLAFTLMTMKI